MQNEDGTSSNTTRNPRFTHWVALFVFSTIVLGSSVSHVRIDTLNIVQPMQYDVCEMGNWIGGKSFTHQRIFSSIFRHSRRARTATKMIQRPLKMESGP